MMMGTPSKTPLMRDMSMDLPAGVLENVFTFLPIASLCRFRTLSKEWNSFISNPSFKRHVRPSSEEEYALITPARWGKLEGGWVVLDVARKRYFKLSDAFLTTHLQQQGLVVAPGAHSFLAAADGGLLCVRCRFSDGTSGLFVCNPILQTVKQLPQPPVEPGEYVVVIATVRSSKEYEIFVVNSSPCKYEPESVLVYEIVVYESETGMWRSAPCRPLSSSMWWGSATVFNNDLYIIVLEDDSVFHEVVSYNKETGVLSCVCVCGIDDPSEPSPLLLVTQARLFFVMFPVGARDDYLPVVQIFEVDVAERESTQVTEMPHALLLWVLGNDLPNFTAGKCEIEVKAAVGCAECILIATIVGRSAAYDLSRKLWHRFSEDRTLVEEYCGADMTEDEVFGSSNCLSLCAP